MHRLFFPALFSFLMIIPLASETVLFVSPIGNDNWSGALPEPNAALTDGPFATLQKAQLEARNAPRTSQITVFIRDGRYFVGKWLFEPQDSGTAGAPVIFTNYGDERPVISGGMAITGWQLQGALWVTTIEEVKSGKLYFKELYVNDERRDRARSPNKGEFFRINGGVEGNDKRSFRFHPGDLQNYENRQDVNICLYQAWLGIHLWIDALNLAQNTVTFAPQLWFSVGNFDSRTRYYVENAFELLDQPGEWYLNRKTGQLFYYPLPGETPETSDMIAPVVDRVLELRGGSANKIRHLNFEGLRFLHADWIVADKNQTEGQAHIMLDDAVVYARYAENCSIIECEIALGGAHGIILSQGCVGNTVEQCHVHTLGGGGVYVGNTTGWSSCERPPASAHIFENTVHNCFIHDLTHVHHGSVGIWIGNCFNNTVTHNKICDLDYTGISVGWCWGYTQASSGGNEIAYNHIHHLGQGELSDMGGIYTLGVAPGTHLHHNLIHDVYSYSYGGWGIYPDEGSSDLLIENNIVYNTKSSSFHQHYGQNNWVRNNIFALSETAGMQRSRNEAGKSFTFENNIILTGNGEALWGSWSDGNFSINHNLYWDINSGERMDFGMQTLTEWQGKGYDKDSKIADPLFADPINGDFTLSSSSPAFSLGFQTIDLSSVGLIGDAEWTDMPKRVTHRTVNPIAQPPVAPFFNRDELLETYEDRMVGSLPAFAQVYGISGPAGQNIYVTDEKSAGGAHSLKFDDRVLSQNTYEPFLYYLPYWYDDGVMSVSFDILMHAGSALTFEYRDEKGYPSGVGPSLALAPGQTWREGTTTVKLPVDEWFHVNVSCSIGGRADGKFDASVTVDGQTVNRLARSVTNKTWKSAMEVYFISNANANTAFYIDNLHFVNQRDAAEVGNDSSEILPQQFSLTCAYPNPFNPATTIILFIADPTKTVKLEVYNIQGKRLRTLHDATLPVGRYSLMWDGRDEAGRYAATGVYWVQMRVQDHGHIWRKKVTFIK